ncbi:hypothetical protein PLESTF_001716000 [Pleodorina starrii]|nr:hypothetical protein PLESTF_001716000 [Pleodorina starrii]
MTVHESYLVETVPASDGTNAQKHTAVDFGSKAAQLATGDKIVAQLQVMVDAKSADMLGLTPGSNGRRLLSEEHETVRRMALDFHTTRRSLQEFNTLFDLIAAVRPPVDVLAAAGATDAAAADDQPVPVAKPKAVDFVVIGKDTEKDLFVANGQQQHVTSLTFVFSVKTCGQNPATSAEKIKQAWFNSAAGSNGPYPANLQRFYEVCSYNQMTFRSENNLVFDVDVPCTGQMSRGKYDLKRGRGNGWDTQNELFALAELAREFVQKTNKTLFADWANYRRKIMIFPFNWASEIMPMAGLAYKAGWSIPIPGGHLNAWSDLRPGIPRDFVLPSMSTGKANMLRIVTDETNTIITDASTAPQRALFVAYRARDNNIATFDSGLLSVMGRDISGQVWVHEYNQTANGLPTGIGSQPLLLAGLNDAANTSFRHQFSSGLGAIAVTFKSKTATAATVTVCRALRQVENAGGNSCSDGADNDCDGLVDMADPDCNPNLRSPPLTRAATSPPPPTRAATSPPPPTRAATSPPPPTRAATSPPPPTRATTSSPPPAKKAAPRTPRSPRPPRTPGIPRPPRGPRTPK